MERLYALKEVGQIKAYNIRHSYDVNEFLEA